MDAVQLCAIQINCPYPIALMVNEVENRPMKILYGLAMQIATVHVYSMILIRIRCAWSRVLARARITNAVSMFQFL